MKKLILVVFILLFLTSLTMAQLFESSSQVGTTAAQFLKIGPGARATALGGAMAASADDIYAVYWNPAGISMQNKQMQAAFNHAEWLADISYDFAAGSLNLGDFGHVFVSFTSLSVPEEKVRTFENPEGNGDLWDASSLSIGIGFAKNLTDRFAFGIQFKYVSESIWNSNASGIAFDIGTLYETPFNGLKIGASISNFGTKMKMEGRNLSFNDDPDDEINTGPNNIPADYKTDEFDLPLSFRIGLAMDIINSRFINISAAVDAVHPNDNTEYLNTGLEVDYQEIFFIRAGYRSLFKKNSEEGLTLGGGLAYNFDNQFTVTVNYGYADFGRLEDIQFFDLGFIF